MASRPINLNETLHLGRLKKQNCTDVQNRRDKILTEHFNHFQLYHSDAISQSTVQLSEKNKLSQVKHTDPIKPVRPYSPSSLVPNRLLDSQDVAIRVAFCKKQTNKLLCTAVLLPP